MRRTRPVSTASLFLGTYVLLLAVCVSSSLTLSRHRRQAMEYTDELREMARVHPGTKIIVGHAARYAPHEWPAWYTRTMMRWDGESRLAPFRDTDTRFASYHQNGVWRGRKAH